MSSSCPTCLEVFTESSHILSTPCGHIFHQSCIDRWLMNQTSCPQCRKNSPRSELRRIYLSTSEGASSQPANVIKKFGVCIIGTDGDFSNSAFNDMIKLISAKWLDLDDNEDTKFIVSKSEWCQIYINTRIFRSGECCGCTGTGKIDCGNKWTQDWILDLLKENPKIQCLKIEDYNELKHVSVKSSDYLLSKIGLGKVEMVKMIKKALKLSEKSIERHLNIEDSRGQLIYLCLLENNDVNALAKRNYKVQAGCEQLTFEIIEKNTSHPLYCYKCEK